MSTETGDLLDDLLAWVRDWHEDETGGEVQLELDTPLLGVGLLDSMGMVAFMTFLEKRTGGTFDYESYLPGPSDSIRTLLEHCSR